MTGQAPVSAVQRKVSDSLLAAQEVEPGVPGYLSNVLEAALALAPGDRLQNVPELMGALTSQRAAESLTRPEPPAPRDGRISAKSLFAGSLVVSLVLFLLLMWSILDRNAPAAESQPASTPPASSEPAQIKTIPNFVGLTFLQVNTDPEYSAGYRFDIVSQEYSSEYGNGVIISQEPEAGTTTSEEKKTISLVVSKGPEMVEMPNIVGFTRESAEKELTDNHIKASFFLQENNGDYASNCVVYTDVEPGTFIDVNKTIVNVYIAKERVVYDPPAATEPPAE